jgi:hypothetical protein
MGLEPVFRLVRHRMLTEVSMSMHSNQHHDYFASSYDGAVWPAVLVTAAMFALATIAWMTA